MFGRKKQVLRSASESIVVNGQSLIATESFNRLKDNVIYFNDGGKNKVFQVESSISGEGKSFVLANLAVSLAQSGKKVILIDMDFRRPKVHREFKLLNNAGVADYMRENVSLEKLVQKTEYNVDVVTSGKNVSNSTLILTSDKFKELIQKFKEEYDYVLLDSPPVLQVSDYIHINKLSDAVIFVVSCGKVKRAQVRDAVEYLKRNDAKIIGTVMTFAENMNAPYKSSYYYKSYMQSYYGPYTKENNK